MSSQAIEEYLEAIYRLSCESPARPTDIAQVVGVSAPTVSVTLGRMAKQGLVSRVGRGVELTAAGRAAAIEVVRRHRIAERFLVDTLGLGWDAAHEEACLLEHALSARVLEALERFLGSPENCPHGHPIPGAAGEVPAIEGVSLVSLLSGSCASVLRVEEGGERLGYVGELGLVPGAKVKVLSIEPFEGPLTVEIDGATRVIAADIARMVTVATS